MHVYKYGHKFKLNCIQNSRVNTYQLQHVARLRKAAESNAGARRCPRMHMAASNHLQLHHPDSRKNRAAGRAPRARGCSAGTPAQWLTGTRATCAECPRTAAASSVVALALAPAPPAAAHAAVSALDVDHEHVCNPDAADISWHAMMHEPVASVRTISRGGACGA